MLPEKISLSAIYLNQKQKKETHQFQAMVKVIVQKFIRTAACKL